MTKLLNKLGLYTKKQQKEKAIKIASQYINEQKWCKHKFKTIKDEERTLPFEYGGMKFRYFHQECENCGQIRTLER